MKKLFLVGIAFCFAAALAYAQDAATTKAVADTNITVTAQAPVAGETITLKGDIIDNMCAGTKDAATLTEFVKTHPKSCALMPDCAATGYSIFADGKLSKFDKESSAKVEEFLNKEDNKLQVTVTAKKVGDELSLVSIENQQ